MIKRTLLLTALLLLAYSLYVKWLAPRWWFATQDTEQENVTKAQQFLYNDHTTYNCVILGSSLSNRIVADSLPHTFNLAFGGQSIFDGLHLLAYKTRLPEVVLVEMNLVLRNENTAFTSSLHSPVNYYLRKEIIAFRADKEPIPVLGKMMMASIYRIKDFIRGVRHKYKQPVKIESPHDLSQKMVKNDYTALLKLPKDSSADHSFQQLKAYINSLQEEKVKVIFFEMPIDNQLENLPLPSFVRKKFNQYFPPSKYQYIARPNWNYCDTFDGQHLTEKQAVIYTAYLKEQLDKLQ